MIRIIFYVCVIAAVYLVGKGILSLLSSKNCRSCNGSGFWRGVRGERNTCEACAGSGRR